MKKLKINFLVLLLIAIFSIGCSKCVDCGSCPEGVTLDATELCQDDFDSKEDYDQAVAVIEAFGCECQ